MKLNVERMDWGIWLFVILPVFAIVIYLVGFEKGLFLLLLLPLFIIVKNEILDRKLSWKPEYSVGIVAFDEEHKKLLELIQQMFKALRRMPGKDEAADVIEELRQYTERHFAGEEELMEQHGYPGLEKHRKEHEEMKRKVGEFQEKFEENSVSVSKEVLRYLQNWLINHINVTDKKYTEFLNNKGVH